MWNSARQKIEGKCKPRSRIKRRIIGFRIYAWTVCPQSIHQTMVLHYFGPLRWTAFVSYDIGVRAENQCYKKVESVLFSAREKQNDKEFLHSFIIIMCVSKWVFILCVRSLTPNSNVWRRRWWTSLYWVEIFNLIISNKRVRVIQLSSDFWSTHPNLSQNGLHLLRQVILNRRNCCVLSNPEPSTHSDVAFVHALQLGTLSWSWTFIQIGLLDKQWSH